MLIYDMLRMEDKPRLVDTMLEDGRPHAGHLIGVSHPDLSPTWLGTAGWWHRKGRAPTQYRVLKSVERIWGIVQDNPSAYPSGPPLVSIDLEQRHLTVDDAVNVLTWIREEFPGLALTVYSPQWAPLRKWWSVVPHLIVSRGLAHMEGYEWFRRQQESGRRDYDARYRAWQASNGITRHVNDLCDVVTISLYPPYAARPAVNILHRWALFAEHLIGVARGLWPGKVIVPWIWHTTGPRFSFAPIGAKYFCAMLDTIEGLGIERVGVWSMRWDSWDTYVTEGYWAALTGTDEGAFVEDDEEEEDDANVNVSNS